MTTTRQQLDTIKLRHITASPGHKLMEDGDGTCLMAGDQPLALLDQHIEIGNREFLRYAHDDVGTLIDIVERGAKTVNQLTRNSEPSGEPGPMPRARAGRGRHEVSGPNSRERNVDSPLAQTPSKNHAAACAITCGKRWFQNYLVQNRGLDLPNRLDEKLRQEMTAIKVRGILKITSRAELNKNKDAQRIWKHLRRDAYNWKDGR